MLMHMFYNLMGTLIVDLESRFLPAIVMGMIILNSIPMTVSAVTLICLTTNNKKKQRFEKMRFVIQRVTEASVTIDGEISGKIGKRVSCFDWSSRYRHKRDCRQNDTKNDRTSYF